MAKTNYRKYDKQAGYDKKKMFESILEDVSKIIKKNLNQFYYSDDDSVSTSERGLNGIAKVDHINEFYYSDDDSGSTYSRGLDCIARVDYKNTKFSDKIGMEPQTDYIVTQINGTPESVKEYYAIGKFFNVGYGHRDKNGKVYDDHMMQVSNCFVLPNDDTTADFIEYLEDTYGYDWKEYFTEDEWNNFITK